EEPCPPCLYGPSNIKHAVVARERLLGIGLRVIEFVPGVERTPTVIECTASVPLVVAAPGAYDDRAAVSARGIGVKLCCSHREILNRIRRIVLKEPSNIIVVVIAAVD